MLFANCFSTLDLSDAPSPRVDCVTDMYHTSLIVHAHLPSCTMLLVHVQAVQCPCCAACHCLSRSLGMSAEELTPHIKYSLAKYVDKGEDAWVQQPGLDCALAGNAGALALSHSHMGYHAHCMPFYAATLESVKGGDSSGPLLRRATEACGLRRV